MNEGTKKIKPTKPQQWNPLVLERLNKKYGFTKFYIRQCLRGDRQNETADKLQKDYKLMCDEVDKLLKNI